MSGGFWYPLIRKVSRELDNSNVTRYYVSIMIRSFADKDTEALFHRCPNRKPPRTIHKQALRKLLMIDAATELRDLKAPLGNHLEKLSGSRKDQYSIRINDQWRICFTWRYGTATEVEIVDYH